MRATFLKGALVGGIAGAMMAAGTAALAGTGIGDVFNLGKINTVNTTSDLSGNVAAPQLRVTNANAGGSGVLGRHAATSGDQPGVYGETKATTSNATGVFGFVPSSASAGDSSGVKGLNYGAGRGVTGQSTNGAGVFGTSSKQYGVWGIGSYGVVAGGSQGGVWASTDNAAGSGVYGQNTAVGGAGVHGTAAAANGRGVFGSGEGIGVEGRSARSIGVFGAQTGSVAGYGVYGSSANGVGVVGDSDNVAVDAQGGKIGLRAGGTQYAGRFSGLVYISGGANPVALSTSGNILVDGDISASGTKTFKIDHPLAPRRKYLRHAAVESPEVLNVYSGNVTTDARGFATVQLAPYFGAINKDFRYQLTPVGGLVLAAVTKEVQNNRFVIQTSKPHTKVSWQVTGVRNDRYMRAHPFRAVTGKE